ncbi:MAG: hypothetical protein AABM67_20150 [Acidobacteriota bacterium]
MAERLPIAVAALQVDLKNWRLPEAQNGQREAQREIARRQGPKLLKLADDMAKYGPNLAELPIVMPFGTRYIVLEGNRRLVALRALENPQWLVGVFDPKAVVEMRNLSKRYLQNPIASIYCLVVQSREEADHWIDLRHAGEKQGAGIVKWGADEKARYLSRATLPKLHTQALDFLQNRGDLTPELRQKVPTDSFRRLIGTPEVQAKLGIDLKGGKMIPLASDSKVAKALMYVVNDLASKETKTKQIYDKDDRIKYAKKLPASITVTPSAKTTRTQPPSKPQPRVSKFRPPMPRDELIPPGCVLTITPPRIQQIAGELKSLSLTTHSNAISVLFRVFVELSCDAYIADVGVNTTANIDSYLSTKLQDTAGDLVARGQLTQQQARPVRIAAEKDKYFAASVSVMNEYIHSPYIFPMPGDLRAGWDSLQPFFIALWSVHASLRGTLARTERK